MPRIVVALLLSSLLGACAYPYNVGVKATDGTTVALMPGQSASLADGLLRYVRLANDSRCKPDVQCVWAGDAVIELHWVPATGAPRDLSLHLNPQAGPSTARLDTREVTFTHLARPQPQASLRIDLARDP
ncbi:MAG TPA: hypothetical protein PLI83_01935 [Thermomonas sp.]|jgi:hypothetical protein|uniref:hypothetical protein n=1 Tax=Thermomonas sp. TaxID=1971895 RepID=UPI002C5C1708|nr:hypothetical protein [Thermomonas sp.]HOZ23527.1 hypothetical protein [Thermomonas sp.]HPM57303.1 hypothetical protein [Thermomonas sp.]HPW12030.1 hypothetical protein [Thermomonas sp.]